MSNLFWQADIFKKLLAVMKNIRIAIDTGNAIGYVSNLWDLVKLANEWCKLAEAHSENAKKFMHGIVARAEL